MLLYADQIPRVQILLRNHSQCYLAMVLVTCALGTQEAGEQAAEAKDYSKALCLWDEALKSDHNNAAIHELRAQVRHTALHLHCTNDGDHLALHAKTLRMRSDSSRLIRALHVISTCLRHVVQVLLEAGQYWEAVQAASRAAQLQPGWPAAHITLARAQLNFGEPQLALTSFDQAIKLQVRPQCGATYRRRGCIACICHCSGKSYDMLCRVTGGCSYDMLWRNMLWGSSEPSKPYAARPTTTAALATTCIESGG
jgi:tetratricopeptide (TPR) repeat protein